MFKIALSFFSRSALRKRSLRESPVVRNDKITALKRNFEKEEGRKRKQSSSQVGRRWMTCWGLIAHKVKGNVLLLRIVDNRDLR